jgi:hypothetical protein
LKALEINKRSFGEDHVEFAITLGNFSNVLKDLCEYEESYKGYLKALEIIKKNYGENHIYYK